MSKKDRSASSRLRRRLAGVRRRGERWIRKEGAEEALVSRGPGRVVFEGRAEGVVPNGMTLLAASRTLAVDMDSYCGGNCECGTCRVEILDGAENLSPQSGQEQIVLGSTKVDAGDRLACQARILGPVRVRVPDWF